LVAELTATDIYYRKIDYDPSQGGLNTHQPAIIDSDAHYIIVTGGEGSGKSVVLSKKWLDKWLEDQIIHAPTGDGEHDPLLYWLIAAAYGEAVKEFMYIADDLQAIGFPVKQVKIDAPGYIEVQFPDETKPRLRIEVKSATDITKLSKDRPHGIILCEAAQMGVEIYERARSRVAGYDGWMLIAGTMEREMGPWFRNLAMQWTGADRRQSFRLPSYTNMALYPGGRNDPKILALERESSDEFFMERIEGIPVPPKGLVFPEFDASIHIKEQDYIPGMTVYMGEDPGFGQELTHAHSLEIFQKVVDYLPNGQPYEQMRQIDEIYEHGLITEDIINIAMSREWWKEINSGGIKLYSDPHYRDQHHSMNSVGEQWLSQTSILAGPAKVNGKAPKIPIMPAIERMKTFLKPNPLTHMPGVTFHPKARGVLSELGVGGNPLADKEQGVGTALRPYRWDVDKDGQTYGQVPKDRYNDGIKGVQYLLVGEFGYARAQRRSSSGKRWRNGVTADG
jgi:hypothetical protein